MLYVNYRKQIRSVFQAAQLNTRTTSVLVKNHCAASKDKSEFNKSKTTTPQHDSNSEETITAVFSKQYVIYLYLWI